jgi:hypothetical protein
VKILVLAAAVFVSGCATQAVLEVYSQPPGAYITEVESGRAFGISPIFAVYDPSILQQHQNPKGCYMVRGFEAKWVSGARTTITPIELCGAATGRFNITLARDPKAPGLDRDMQFAIQVQQAAAAQQQAAAAQQQADAANQAAFWNAYRALNPAPAPTLNCTTMPSGLGTQTTCR